MVWSVKEFSKLGSILLTSLICYFLLAYYISRDNTIILFFTVGVLFILYFFILKNQAYLKAHFNHIVIFAFICRASFLFSTPLLSDDFYRFIWDGRLIDSGLNPFAFFPDFIQQNYLLPGQSNEELFQNMNSPHYYSLYPPFLQLCFYLSAKFSFGSNFFAIFILRLFILIAEYGTFVYLRKILTILNFEREKVFFYLLNPLIIIELTGNIHFEGVMLFFVVSSLCYLLLNKNNISAMLFALAVCTKLIPLILLPLIMKKIGFKKGLVYASISFAIVIILFLPFVDNQLINNFGNSIGLYFQKFEFNASLYYLFREIGYHLVGYNAIGIIGKILPLISFGIILLISFRYKNEMGNQTFFKHILFILLSYYTFSLIVHPWYVSFLVLVGCFTNYRFALVWSAFIFGTYITYNSLPYKENLLVVGMEYFVVFSFLIFEQKKLKTFNIFY